LLNRHLATGTLLVIIIILGLILLVSSCSPPKQNLTTTPSPESGGQITSEPATEELKTALSYLVNGNPAEVDNSKLPITPTEQINITGSAPEVDIAKYRLTIGGLVDTEVALSYDTLLSYPTVTNVVLLICPGFFVDNAEWTGVPVNTLLAEAGIRPQASKLIFYSLDGYETVLSLEEVQQDGVFLAHTVNGQVLPKEHGFPLRLVVTGEYGSAWVKWVDRIDVR
jgi:DMSO/TMAO reductase YedYZ molybdopterin-dependent catalytic subunit